MADDIPVFDPSQPSDDAAPVFDPSQPSQDVTPKFDPNQPSQDVTAGSADTNHLPNWFPGRKRLDVQAVGNIIPDTWGDFKSGLSTANEYLNPFSAAYDKRMQEKYKDYNKNGPAGISSALNTDPLVGAGGLLGAAGSVVSGPVHSVIGRPYAWMTGKTQQEANADLDLAMSAMKPTPGALGRTVPMPAKPVPNGPLGVTLSEGQATGDLAAIQAEQAARRNQMGKSAQRHAAEFFDNQQVSEVAAKHQDVKQSLDNLGNIIADNPQQAGELVGNKINSLKRGDKDYVDALYENARRAPGEIHSGALEGLGQKIKGDLTFGEDAVSIDGETPFASKAINYIDNEVTKLKVQNKADPFNVNGISPVTHRLQPNVGEKFGRETVTGLSLDALDKMRKRLSGYRQDAFDSGTPTDRRAIRAVMRSFDDNIDKAIRGGSFTGDKSAVQAWWDARASHSEYKQNFHNEGNNDTVGKIVERITGRGNTPQAIGNDVADFLYGSSGVNPSSLVNNTAEHILNVVGRESPTASAIRQGHFSRMTEVPGANGEMVPKTSAQIVKNVDRFLHGDGVELSRTLYSQDQRDLLQQYANLHRKLIIPQGGANWAGTAAGVAPMLKKIGNKVGMLVGGFLGHSIAAGPTAAGVGAALALGAGKIGESMTAAKVAKQMPLIGKSMAEYQRAYNKAQKANTPINQAALNTAAANLMNTTLPIGMTKNDFEGLTGAAKKDWSDLWRE